MPWCGRCRNRLIGFTDTVEADDASAGGQVWARDEAHEFGQAGFRVADEVAAGGDDLAGIVRGHVFTVAIERAVHVVPRGQEPRVGGGLDRLDGSAQRRERAHADAPEALGVAPLGLFRQQCRGSLGQEEPADRAPAGLEPVERVPGDGGADAEPGGQIGDGEGAVRARVAADEVAKWIGQRFRECDRHADGKGRAEGVTQPTGVFDGRVPVVAGDADADRALAAHELVEVRGRFRDVGVVGRGVVGDGMRIVRRVRCTRWAPPG